VRTLGIMVDTVRLDDERDGAGPMDLIKIDVEGHEQAVIRGALAPSAAIVRS
jgi:FkbM family methyltransferase